MDGDREPVLLAAQSLIGRDLAAALEADDVEDLLGGGIDAFQSSV